MSPMQHRSKADCELECCRRNRDRTRARRLEEDCRLVQREGTAMGRALFAALLILIAAPPARADVRILASPGGEGETYLELFSMLRQSGQRVLIDGPCFSACTLVLSTIPTNRICVPTSRAGLPLAPVD